ncbi:hypothetical protein BDZ45DRAFT_797423 [Acephala macrosclerotiorum]|nr:hypothetical protein BDZ45DRAFT_797423 [Acephala macrosclerotiorum]
MVAEEDEGCDNVLRRCDEKALEGQHKIGPFPTPSPSPYELLIKITAIAINPIDWKLRDDSPDALTYPTILSSDASGLITEAGSSSTNSHASDRVFQGITNNPTSSTVRRYCLIPSPSPTHPSSLREIGATHVLDRSTASPIEYANAVDGLEARFVLDAISVLETQGLGVEILQLLEGGEVVTLLPVHEDPIEVPNPDPKRSIFVGAVMKAMGGEDGWLAKGVLKPNKVEVIPGGLSSLEKALDRNKGGVSGVKIVIQPQQC